MGKGPETEQANCKVTGRHEVIGFLLGLPTPTGPEGIRAASPNPQDLVNSGGKELGEQEEVPATH